MNAVIKRSRVRSAAAAEDTEVGFEGAGRASIWIAEGWVGGVLGGVCSNYRLQFYYYYYYYYYYLLVLVLVVVVLVVLLAYY
jgi:hypothetical protein